MVVIYHCYGGSHSSVTAAALHLGILPQDRLPSASEFLSIPYFDACSTGEEGIIKHMGVDGDGNQIYVAGKKSLGRRFENILYGLAEALEINRENIKMIDTNPLVNPLMKVGGFMSRRMGIVNIGRPLVIAGTMRAYFQLVDLVIKKKGEIRY